MPSMKYISSLLLAALLGVSGVTAVPVASQDAPLQARNPVRLENIHRAVKADVEVHSLSKDALVDAPVDVCLGIADCNPVDVNGKQKTARSLSKDALVDAPVDVCLGIADCNPVDVNGKQKTG